VQGNSFADARRIGDGKRGQTTRGVIGEGKTGEKKRLPADANKRRSGMRRAKHAPPSRDDQYP
jgi:hypothetical protein